MFAIVVLIPLLTFFVFGRYVANIIKCVAVDSARFFAYICGYNTFPSILDARVYIAENDTKGLRIINVTRLLQNQLFRAIRSSPLARHHVLSLAGIRETYQPHLLSVEYQFANSDRFKRFYSQSKHVLFPPKTFAPTTHTHFPLSSYLLLQQVAEDGRVYKQVKKNVTQPLKPILGPYKDWFSGRQRQPLVVFFHLYDNIKGLTWETYIGPIKPLDGKLTLTLKTKGRHQSSSLSLSKYIPYLISRHSRAPFTNSQ